MVLLYICVRPTESLIFLNFSAEGQGAGWEYVSGARSQCEALRKSGSRTEAFGFNDSIFSCGYSLFNIL